MESLLLILVIRIPNILLEGGFRGFGTTELVSEAVSAVSL